jgi:hypothetical protein
MKRRDCLEDLGVDGSIILQWTWKKWVSRWEKDSSVSGWGAVNLVMNLRVPYKAVNFLTSWVTISVSRRTLLHGASIEERMKLSCVHLGKDGLPTVRCNCSRGGGCGPKGDRQRLMVGLWHDDTKQWIRLRLHWSLVSSATVKFVFTAQGVINHPQYPSAAVTPTFNVHVVCPYWRTRDTHNRVHTNSLSHSAPPPVNTLTNFQLNKPHGAEQLVKKFSAFYGARRFITVFTTVRHWSVFWARCIQSTLYHSVSLRSILMLSSHLREFSP